MLPIMENKNKYVKRALLCALFGNISLLCFGNTNEAIVTIENGTAYISLWNTIVVTLGSVLAIAIPAYYNRKHK